MAGSFYLLPLLMAEAEKAKLTLRLTLYISTLRRAIFP